MSDEDERVRIRDLERRILCALCRHRGDNADAGSVRGRVVRELAAHPWQTPDHRVVFEALMRARGRNTRALQEVLPAEATRMGFPDIDWESYFEGEEIPPQDIEEILRALVPASKERRR